MKRFIIILLVLLPVVAVAQDTSLETIQYLCDKYGKLPQHFLLNPNTGVGVFAYGDINNPKAVMVVDTITKQPLIFVIRENGKNEVAWQHRDLEALKKQIAGRTNVEKAVPSGRTLSL